MDNDKIPLGIRVYLIENYAPILKSLGDMVYIGLVELRLNLLFSMMHSYR